MNITLCQHIVSSDLQANLAHIEAQIKQAKAGEWLIFPEGMLSGYEPDNRDYTKNLDGEAILSAIETIHLLCNEHNVHCIFGTAYPDGGKWYNATVVCLSGQDKAQLYYKNNTAYMDDFKHFSIGHSLPVYDNDGIRFGIQMCLEVLSPEQWRVLKQQGAQVIFHINNAIKPEHDIWENLLITRAMENNFYVVSVNNAAKPQKLPSYVLSPKGEVMTKLRIGKTYNKSLTINAHQVREHYYQRFRDDLARVSTIKDDDKFRLSGMTWLEQSFYESWRDMIIYFSSVTIGGGSLSEGTKSLYELLLYFHSSAYGRKLRAGQQMTSLIFSRALHEGLMRKQHSVRVSAYKGKFTITYKEGGFGLKEDEKTGDIAELMEVIIPFFERLLEQPID